MTLMWSNHIR